MRFGLYLRVIVKQANNRETYACFTCSAKVIILLISLEHYKRPTYSLWGLFLRFSLQEHFLRIVLIFQIFRARLQITSKISY